jgi:hypothetical protein
MGVHIVTGLLMTGIFLPALPAIASEPAPVQLAQVIIRERVIIRVPAQPAPVQPMQPIKWKEKSAGRCIMMTGVAGAAMVDLRRIDLVLRDGRRFRTQFDGPCPALDFYSGFYVKNTGDGQLCAGRDAIHARSGGQCTIKRFRRLVRDK